MSIEQLKEEFEAVKTKMRETGKVALKESVDKIFAEHPELESFGWTQYTPYFNDGDPCNFRVGEVRVINGHKQYDDEEDEEGGCWWDKNVSSGWGKDEKRGPLYEVYDKVGRLIGSCPEELLEFAFGNDVKVTVTRKGFDTDDYDNHD